MVKIEHDFTVEYAKSNRSACKGCKNTIDKDALRIGKMVQAPNFDGKIPLWYHFSCFYAGGNQGLTDPAMLHNKDNIKYEDLQKIIAKMDSPGATAPPPPEKCGSCKADVQPQWKACPMCGESLEKKRKADDQGGVGKKQKLSPKEQEVVDQNKLIFEYREALKKNFSVPDVKRLLEHNKVPSHGGEQDVIRRCAEAMLFGVLPLCPDCGDGHLHVVNGTYKCTGHASEWARCMYETDEVETTKFKIPKKPKMYLEDEWLSELDLEPRKRVLIREEIKKKEVNVDDVISGNAAAGDLGKDRPYYKIGNPTKKPLEGKTIALAGKFDVTLAEMKKLITKLGGTHSDKVQVGVTHLVCKENEWEANKKKANSKCEQAKGLDIPVLKPEWIEEAEAKGAIVDELKFLIGGSKNAKRKMEITWGPPAADKKPVEEEKKVKLVMKGRAAVDPLAGQKYIDDFHVLDEGKALYNVVLNVTDITQDTNSYYGLQILEADKKNGWALFRKWGRVGTKIGGSKIEDYKKKETAIKEFEKLYEEKTGNVWANRNHFEKKPGKFYPIDIDYGEDEKKEKGRIDSDAKSKLDLRLQNFVSLIFDLKLMEEALKEMEIDLTKMPLGKLSKKHINDGMEVLKHIGEVIDSKDKPASKKNKILALTNEFYTKIPHDFGTEQGPLIDNTEILQEKIELMNALIEMEIATSLMKSTNEDGGESVIDQEYAKLKTLLTPLDKDDEEYKMASKFCQNQQGTFKLKVVDIFKSEREGEEKRFENSKFAHHNRKLLWHGSRLTNYVGILSQGLRIAPPEAPKSGYRFGKGVYFADLCEKSAGYCRAAGTDALIMMLCEVALGDEKQLYQDQYMEKPLPGSHSTHAMGAIEPNPKETLILDDKKYGNLGGVQVPLGKPVRTGVKSSCQHNEYIVYNVEQVRIRYVLRLTFA